MTTLRIGTRGSRLALWQAYEVRDQLRAAWPELEVEVVEIKTQGDRIVDRPLAAIGGKGLFVKEIERALIDGDVDIAVHSAKDLPAEMPDGLELIAVLQRERAADVLITRNQGMRLADLPQGARVGTSSLRRRAMLLASRPDLDIISLRGNVPTRIQKVKDGVDGLEAAVLAYAGVHRLELDHEIAEVLAFEAMLPPAGQGVVAIQGRTADSKTLEALAAINHAPSRRVLDAERAALATLEGSCHVPVGIHAEPGEEGTLGLAIRVLAPDGSDAIDVAAEQRSGEAAASFGRRVAEVALEAGAAELLAAAPSTSGGLAGKRVIVTRSRTQASKLTGLVEAHAGRPVEVPLIAVEPLATDARDTALQGLGDDEFDWLVLTSPNGALHGVPSGTRVGRAMVAAVGPATADALSAQGVSVDLTAATHTSEGLLEALLAVGVETKRILILAAETTRGVLEAGLEAAGAELVRVPVYRTTAAPGVEERMRGLLAEPDGGWVTFASSSAVAAFRAAFRDALPSSWRVAVIGPVTADSARRAGLDVAVVAPESTLPAMVAAMAALDG